MWDVEAGDNLTTFAGHSGTVFDMALSADEKRLVTASRDNSVKLWDVRTGQVLLALRGHAGAVYSVDFSPDGRLLASGGSGDFKLWRSELDAVPRQ